MARVRRTENNIYRGDGESILFQDDEWEEGENPYRVRSVYEEKELVQQNRFFNHETDDGLGMPVYDEFDESSPAARKIQKTPTTKKRKTIRHRPLWIGLIFVCLIMLSVMTLVILPQVAGVRYRFLPNLAFVNGSVIALNGEEYATWQKYRDYIYTDAIYPNIWIDGIYVGDMTRGQAVTAVSSVIKEEGADFDITVQVGNGTWHLTPQEIPVTRNIEETVEMAYATGRNNTAALGGSDTTPFRERLEAAMALRGTPCTFDTVMTWDREALRSFAEDIVSYVNREPVNSTVASFDFGTRTFTFSDDIPGARLDANEVYDKVAALLDEGTDRKTVSFVPEKVLAPVTRTELMNSFVKISSYTTKTTSDKNRNTNIRLSAEAINGTTVLPGDIFSFNGTTGERTKEKGYKEAAAISGGTTYDEVGGGVCQTSSTLFNAVARADLEILSRSPHAWPSSYVEKGMDATVNWPGLDFKFRNNSDWPVFIVAYYNKQKITVDLYGMTLGSDISIDLESVTTRVIDEPSGINYVINTDLKPGESKKTITGRKGYVVETWQVWYQGGKEIRRELLCTSNYKAYQETIEYNPTY